MKTWIDNPADQLTASPELRRKIELSLNSKMTKY